jgi:DNA polymerase-3 subunit alpha
MRQAGLKRNDAYWTGLLKRPKDDKMISPAEIKAYGPFLQQEVELLKPELIVCLGSNAARFFVPDLKGSIFDHVGKVVYLPKIEATVIIGLNPAMIHHDKAKMDDLVAVFKNAKEIITPIL